MKHQEEQETNAETEQEPPTLKQIKKVIRAQKNIKTPGIYEIPSEIYKLGGNHLTKHIHALITNIWINEDIPNDWRKSVICPIYKKR